MLMFALPNYVIFVEKKGSKAGGTVVAFVSVDTPTPPPLLFAIWTPKQNFGVLL